MYFRWRTLPHLKEKRDGLALAWLRQSGSVGYLYAIGGTPRVHNCVECIQLAAQKSKKKTPEDYCDIDEDIYYSRFIGDAWQIISPMLYPRRDICVVTFRGLIIVAGGNAFNEAHASPTEVSNAVEMFTPNGRNGDGQWTQLAGLITPRVLVGLLLLNDGLIAVGK